MKRDEEEEMNYGLKVEIAPGVASKPDNFRILGNLIREVFIRQLAKDGKANDLRQNGAVLEVYLKDRK